MVNISRLLDYEHGLRHCLELRVHGSVLSYMRHYGHAGRSRLSARYVQQFVDLHLLKLPILAEILVSSDLEIPWLEKASGV